MMYSEIEIVNALEPKCQELEVINNLDYPYTPATAHAIPTFASIRTLGERLFSTGGATVNEASHATARSLGFSVDEQWRSYQRPN